MEILKRDFMRYAEIVQGGGTLETWALEPLKIQYKDYAAWQNSLIADTKAVEAAKEFWKNQLTGMPPRLNLPYDYTSETAMEKGSAAFTSVIPVELTQRLRTRAQESQASLFMVLLSGYNILLSRLTGQKEIQVAIPGAARQHEELRDVIGMFVNTLVLGNKVDRKESFDQFFHRFQEQTFGVLENQGIPLELVCGELKIKYPEISVFFNMVNTGDSHRQNLPEHEDYHIDNVQETKFDLVSYVTEYKDGIAISLHYRKDRFKAESIQRLMTMYRKILQWLVTDSRKPIGEYTLGEKKKRKLRRTQQ